MILNCVHINLTESAVIMHYLTFKLTKLMVIDCMSQNGMTLGCVLSLSETIADSATALDIGA